MAREVLCHTPFGSVRLERYPSRSRESLRAWCAADLLLLEAMHAQKLPAAQVLAVNDEHGALCVASACAGLWTDSALSAEALNRNLRANERAPIPIYWSTQAPPSDATTVLLRVPKLLPYFEYQLAMLQQHLAPGALVLAAGMDKHLSPRVARLLEHYIGPTQRHPGERKARLFSARLRKAAAVKAPNSVRYHCMALNAELESLPNVFSQEKLDGGSRLLLEHIPALRPAKTVVDVACGNGVLGLGAFQAGIADRVVFADESAMATASARANSERLFPSNTSVFHHGDGLQGYNNPRADLILCNPPFHSNHAVDEFAGRRILGQCARHLQSGGRLCVVANRHLKYEGVLRRHFSRVARLAEDRRYKVWLAEHV